MTDKQAIKAIKAIIQQVTDNHAANDYKRGNNGLNKRLIIFTISRITKPRLTPNAIHYQDCKKRLHYHDYYNSNEKKTIEDTLNRLKSYADETSLSLQVFNQSNPKPMWIHCYSSSKLSDNSTDNEASYVYQNFSEGNVVKIKMLNDSLFTRVDKVKDNQAVSYKV